MVNDLLEQDMPVAFIVNLLEQVIGNGIRGE
jgi:hypothetical protein